MSAAAVNAAANFFEEHAWMLGEAEHEPCLTPQAQYLRETRIAAAVFKRRFRLIMAWRRQDQLRRQARARQASAEAAPARASARDIIAVSTNLPPRLPALREEIPILRGFLARDIDALLFGES